MQSIRVLSLDDRCKSRRKREQKQCLDFQFSEDMKQCLQKLLLGNIDLAPLDLNLEGLGNGMA